MYCGCEESSKVESSSMTPGENSWPYSAIASRGTPLTSAPIQSPDANTAVFAVPFG